jgi:hypothetical protein
MCEAPSVGRKKSATFSLTSASILKSCARYRESSCSKPLRNRVSHANTGVHEKLFFLGQPSPADLLELLDQLTLGSPSWTGP